MEPVEIILKRERGRGRMTERIALVRYIASTYVNITMCPLYS
jgi:hypothetical protein